MSTIPETVQAIKEACTAFAPICWMDKHEGAGTWMAGFATLGAVVAAIAVPIRERRLSERRAARQRFEVSTSRRAVHECLQCVVKYDAETLSSGYLVEVSLVSPPEASLMPAQRIRGRQQFVPTADGSFALSGDPDSFGFGAPEQSRSLTVKLSPASFIPTQQVTGAFFVAERGDNWRINEATVLMKLFSLGDRKPLVAQKTRLTPFV